VNNSVIIIYIYTGRCHEDEQLIALLPVKRIERNRRRSPFEQKSGTDGW